MTACDRDSVRQQCRIRRSALGTQCDGQRKESEPGVGEARLVLQYFVANLKNKCRLKHSSTSGERAKDIAMFINGSASGSHDTVAIRLGVDVHRFLRGNHPASTHNCARLFLGFVGHGDLLRKVAAKQTMPARACSATSNYCTQA
jgi:hypothetical protein